MNMIVAVDENWAIGKGGEQLIYISADLKRFKALTMGHPLILGRKTLATFPGGRPLKGRRNLILSRSPCFAPEGGEEILEYTLDEGSPQRIAQATAACFGKEGELGEIAETK